MSQQYRRLRIMAVEHHSTLRDGLVALIDIQPDMELVGIVSTADQAVNQFCEVLPDFALVDVDMPHRKGLETIRRILQKQPNARIIALVAYEWDELAVAALEAGASTFLAKDQIGERLLSLIRGAQDDGRSPFS